MSIRTFLTLVIAVMGAALVAVVSGHMIAEVQRSARARDVAALAKISQALLPALVSSRIERGTVVVASLGPDPADDAARQRLTQHRPIADGMVTQSIAALRVAPLQRGTMLAQELAEAFDQMTALRPRIDAALGQSRNQRDPFLVARYGEISATYVAAITDAADETEQATALFDPEIDRLIFVNRQASAARNYMSLITLRMETADVFNLPWRPEDVIAAAEDRGRSDLAWQSLLGVAAWPGTPDGLHRAVEAAKAAFGNPDSKRQATIIAELQAGRPSGVPVSELQALNTGLLAPLNEVVRVATDEIVIAASRNQDEARRSLMVTGVLLAVILCLTGLGIAVVHQRVSTPIRRLTRQMSRLKESEIDFEVGDDFHVDAQRDDEIGEMARALIVFRGQMEEHGRLLQEHEARQFLETLIDAMPVSITFKDTDLRYRYVNRSRRAALGEGAGLVVGKRLSEIADGMAAAAVEAADRALLATGEPQAFEQARAGPDGNAVIVWSLKTPFRETDGSIHGIITCGVYITRLKETEAELMAQRAKAEGANRAKTAFLASMSHELRTPLNAIIGFADVLAKGYLGTLVNRQQEYVADIRSSGEHLLKLVNDLLDLSSLEIGRQVLAIAALDFDRLAAAALSMVQPQAEQAGLTLDCPPTGVTLRADERALTQILVNLLGNAIKFSPSGGRIALHATALAGTVRISVQDSGFGMTAAQRDSALTATVTAAPSGADPYKTRPKGGAGLGLAICRRLIEQHGGNLTIESETGRGSTVNVVLPSG